MEDKVTQFTPALFLKTITIIHFALLFGIILLGGAIFLVTVNPTLNWKDTNELFYYAVPTLAIACIVAGRILYKNQLDKISKITDLRHKLMGFQTASIIKYALLEGASLFGIVAVMQTENLFYFVIVGVLVVYNFSQRPTKERVINDLNLDGTLKDQFNDMNKNPE